MNRKQTKQLKKQLENQDKNPPKMRQIIIETDGNNIKVVKADVHGSLEFIAVLQKILNNISKTQ